MLVVVMLNVIVLNVVAPCKLLHCKNPQISVEKEIFFIQILDIGPVRNRLRIDRFTT
jgi:hypothetical protein